MLIGYCPQINPILDLLTGREHLKLFSAIKGIPPTLQDRLVNDKIEEMGL